MQYLALAVAISNPASSRASSPAGLAASLPSGLPANGDWLSSRGSSGNLGAAVLRAPASPAPQPWTFTGSGRVWGYQPGMSVWSSPALGVVDGRAVLLVGSYDHNVYALDAATGTELWSFTTGGGVYRAPLIWHDGEEVWVFATASDRLVYGLDARLGRRRWIHSVASWRPTLGGARLTAPAFGQVGGRPALFVGHWVWDRSLGHPQQDSGVTALDARSGEPLWQRQLGASALADPLFVESAGQGWVLIGGDDGQLHALNAETGATRWSRTELEAVRGSVAVTELDGTTVVALGSRAGLLRLLDLADGRERWRHKTGDRISGAPLIAELDGRTLVLVGSLDRTLYAVDARSGKVAWRYWTRGGLYEAPAWLPENPGGLVVTTAWDHHLHGLDAHAGALRWLAYTGRPLWDVLSLEDSAGSAPVIAELNGQVLAFLGSYSGSIYGLVVDRLGPLQGGRRRSNLAFWISLPLVLLGVAGLALGLTWRGRRRGSA